MYYSHILWLFRRRKWFLLYILLLLWLFFLHKNIIFKIAFLNNSIRLLNLSSTMLNPIHPFSLIFSFILPFHNSESMPFIIVKMTLIYTISRPSESPVTILFIIFKRTIVLIIEELFYSSFLINFLYWLYPFPLTLF